MRRREAAWGLLQRAQRRTAAAALLLLQQKAKQQQQQMGDLQRRQAWDSRDEGDEAEREEGDRKRHWHLLHGSPPDARRSPDEAPGDEGGIAAAAQQHLLLHMLLRLHLLLLLLLLLDLQPLGHCGRKPLISHIQQHKPEETQKAATGPEATKGM